MPNILVIDDEKKIVDLLVEYLSGLGYTVKGATAVHTGIREAGKLKPDLIILDYHMPDGGGPEVLKNLRQRTLTKDVPVLFLSATPKYEILYNVPESPLIAFLEKPIDFEKLKAAVKEFIGGDGSNEFLVIE